MVGVESQVVWTLAQKLTARTLGASADFTCGVAVEIRAAEHRGHCFDLSAPAPGTRRATPPADRDHPAPASPARRWCGASCTRAPNGSVPGQETRRSMSDDEHGGDAERITAVPGTHQSEE